MEPISNEETKILKFRPELDGKGIEYSWGHAKKSVNRIGVVFSRLVRGSFGTSNWCLVVASTSITACCCRKMLIVERLSAFC